uniref:Uncharacterized protein n=1 Tax=Rhizochromulina marina TaxID=1034831 RepID=A0A7S2W2P9_9STRA|mmetsp:Transcript_12396/g.35852  ORF Transcript_12396/g.35852 Transcript_12396/m.35852 type:complete len:178 (+) Transcript_12396:191-724(+)
MDGAGTAEDVAATTPDYRQLHQLDEDVSAVHASVWKSRYRISVTGRWAAATTTLQWRYSEKSRRRCLEEEYAAASFAPRWPGSSELVDSEDSFGACPGASWPFLQGRWPRQEEAAPPIPAFLHSQSSDSAVVSDLESGDEADMDADKEFPAVLMGVLGEEKSTTKGRCNSHPSVRLS